MRQYGVICFVTVIGLFQRATCELRFIGLGNFGLGKEAAKVAETIKTLELPSFIVSPGSNFHDGVRNRKDKKWIDKFHAVYDDKDGKLKLPFFTVMGTEDWAGNPAAQITATRVEGKPLKDLISMENDAMNKNSPKWIMPNYWYHYGLHFPAAKSTNIVGAIHDTVSVGFYFLDTFVIQDSFPYKPMRIKAREDLEKFAKLAPKIFDYIIFVADKSIHHVCQSTDSSLSSILDPLLETMDADLYMAGNSYAMESVDSNGVLHIQCGTSAKSQFINRNLYKLDRSKGDSFISGETGYCAVELDGEKMTIRFVNAEGKTVRTVTRLKKKRKQREHLSPFTYFAELPKVEYFPLPDSFLATTEGLTFIKVCGTIGLILLLIYTTMAILLVVARTRK